MATSLKSTLADDQQTEIARRVHQPGVALAAGVARFEPPFQYLRAVIPGFSPEARFILNKVLEGDAEAADARDAYIATVSHGRLGTPLAAGFEYRERDFLLKNDAEYKGFRDRYYPTERDAAGRGGPDSRANQIIDSIVFGTLSDYGFEKRHRKASKAKWTCESRLLARKIVIDFEKGKYEPARYSTFLSIPSLPYSVALGDPFFFSGAQFTCGENDNFEEQLSLFFNEYGRIFPHVLKALEEGIAAADEYLKTITESTVS